MIESRKGYFMKDIGFILKNARENKGYTQKQVMAMTGINSKSLSGYENNVAEPDLYTFSKLAQLYDISADEVLEIKTSQFGTFEAKNTLKLLSLYQNLTPAYQEDLLFLLEEFVKHKK